MPKNGIFLAQFLPRLKSPFLIQLSSTLRGKWGFLGWEFIYDIYYYCWVCIFSVSGVFGMYFGCILLRSQFWSNWALLWRKGFFWGEGKLFLTFIGTSEYVFYLYSVYSVCILGVFYLDPNNINVSLAFRISLTEIQLNSIMLHYSLFLAQKFK